jgi:hypothetical protein
MMNQVDLIFSFPFHLRIRSIYFLFFLSFITFSGFYLSIAAQEMDQLLQKGMEEGITVDLREPLYHDGILSTEKGGVISASQIRIQALHLRYTRKVVDQKLIWTIEGEGDLIVEFGEYIFVGQKLFYDFQTKEGVIEYGKTAVEPWYFGGERLELRADGSYLIYNGYVTTSERDVPDWGIYSEAIQVEKERYLKARPVYIKAFHYTVLWIPSLRADLNLIFDSPIRYRFRWGGHQGPRFGFTYEIFSWKHWKTFVRFDYRLTRGPGGGIETYYRSQDHKTEFQSISYVAKDSSILHPHEKARYRFEGTFQKRMHEDKTSILFTYDKISDKDMPSVYYDRDFDFDTAERTQLRVRRQEEEWIGHFYVHGRVNSFQTIKQELPMLEASLKPFELRQTGVIFENWASASYLNFEYSKYLLHVHNYSSSRFEYFPTLYRPFVMGRFCTLTPEVGMISILYGDSPRGESQWLTLGRAGLDVQTQLYRYYGSLKHIIEPYIRYRYYSAPTSSPHQHYIFDLSDGWTRLNYLSFGIHNAFYAKQKDTCVSRLLSADLYSFAFFDPHKIRQTIPRIYGNLSFFSCPTLKHIFNAAWNLEHSQVDYFNMRTEWTVSTDLAIAAEYRHRGPYWWRKVDQENFFLDMFHSEQRLKHSPLSDRNNTFLLHLFYRLHPNWACELTSRYGWNRKKEPSYLEFEFDVLTTIQTAWNLRFSYQHQEDDDRVALYLNIGLRRPTWEERSRKTFRFE